MKKNKISLAVLLLALSIISLIVVQSYQLYHTYDRKSKELNDNIQSFQDKISFRHEKAEDYRRYIDIVNDDFSVQYKEILKAEFENLIPTQNITISDTLIVTNGVKEKYLVIQGRAFDSISGLSAEQRVLAKDYREIRDVFQDGAKVIPGSVDSSRISIELNQKVIQQIFKKAKFINEMMVQSFKENVLETPQQRIDLVFLDSIIAFELKNEHLPKNYNFCIYQVEQKPVVFPISTRNYKTSIPFDSVHKVSLFPNNTFSDPLYLQINFPQRGRFILKEMTLSIAGSIIVIVLVLVAFVFMFKTIIEQKRLSELKAGFISNMTHEFKTPISTISLACEAIEDSDVNTEKTGKVVSPFIEMIKQENRRLEVLVESILESSALEQQNIKWGKDSVNLCEVAELVVENALFRVGQENCSIQLNKDQESIIALCDRLHFRNLLTNLVDNSIKYSEGKAAIIIDIKQNTNNVVLTISDSGIGIKKEHLDKIFDKLYRVPTGNIHNVKGFGLGLNYVKRICDGYDWDIMVTSRYGQGTTFVISMNKE
ncbi:MAG: HAMP domain-containing sensor histidine kinase [Crocinitomicaceae bacterium]|nr:HAMP domain-containing sensor histidine kinase [Crocinitomicaceae bacterium]